MVDNNSIIDKLEIMEELSKSFLPAPNIELIQKGYSSLALTIIELFNFCLKLRYYPSK